MQPVPPRDQCTSQKREMVKQGVIAAHVREAVHDMAQVGEKIAREDEVAPHDAVDLLREGGVPRRDVLPRTRAYELEEDRGAEEPREMEVAAREDVQRVKSGHEVGRGLLQEDCALF